MDLQHFARTVRALRKGADLTQEDLGLKLDLSPAAIGSWESGRAKPRLGKMQELADLFWVTVSYLMGEDSLPLQGAQTASVPLVATSHMGTLADDEEPDRAVQVPVDIISRHPGCFAVHAEGGCMDKRYPPDCIILIDPNMPPRVGDAVMARFQDGRSVIRAYMPGSSVLMLSPDSWSGTYDDIIIHADDEPVELVGVAVWYARSCDIVR